MNHVAHERAPKPQQQSRQPGIESEMDPRPEYIRADYRGSGKLDGKIALITGGDSGIGRAVAVHFAREGADVAIAYLNESDDAAETRRLVEAEGRKCLAIATDVGDETGCKKLVAQVIEKLGRIDVLVNNAAEQHEVKKPEDLHFEQIARTFKSNIFAHMFLVSASLPHMKEGSSIIATSSVTAVDGHQALLDYASTKGAILAYTYSLARALADRKIRVNAVAPGPIWTPLIPASFDADKVGKFGLDTPMKRPGQPSEVAPAFVFLASADASYVTGETIHVNGGSSTQ